MKRLFLKSIAIICLLLIYGWTCHSYAHAKMLERIVAIVNEDVILLSEFEDALRAAKKSNSEVTGDEVINDMIDDLLLLNEVKKYRVSVQAGEKETKTDNDKEALIKEYIDRRIKAFIHIPYEDIENYYVRHRELYEGKDFFEVRDKIEKSLMEKELSVRLREYIEKLRAKAYIRIQLIP